jgi:hypothetical protein
MLTSQTTRPLTVSFRRVRCFGPNQYQPEVMIPHPTTLFVPLNTPGTVGRPDRISNTQDTAGRSQVEPMTTEETPK